MPNCIRIDLSVKQLFLRYTLFVVFVSLLAYCSNPEKAISALLSGGLLVIIAGCVFLSLQWSRKRGQVLGLSLFTATTLTLMWRNYLVWSAIFQGMSGNVTSGKFVVASALTALLIANLSMIYCLTNLPSSKDS